MFRMMNRPVCTVLEWDKYNTTCEQSTEVKDANLKARYIIQLIHESCILILLQISDGAWDYVDRSTQILCSLLVLVD